MTITSPEGAGWVSVVTLTLTTTLGWQDITEVLTRALHWKEVNATGVLTTLTQRPLNSYREHTTAHCQMPIQSIGLPRSDPEVRQVLPPPRRS